MSRWRESQREFSIHENRSERISAHREWNANTSNVISSFVPLIFFTMLRMDPFFSLLSLHSFTLTKYTYLFSWFLFVDAIFYFSIFLWEVFLFVKFSFISVVIFIELTFFRFVFCSFFILVRVWSVTGWCHWMLSL